MSLLKLHFRYLFGKRNILLLSVVLLLTGIGFFLSARPFSSPTEHLVNNKAYFHNYFSNCLLLTKILQLLLVSFVMGMSFTPQSDSYNILYLSYKRMRLPFILSKLILLTIVGVSIGFLFSFLYFAIGFLSASWFVFKISHLEAFVLLSLISIYYGLMSCVLVFLLKSPLVSVISYIMYLASEFFRSLDASRFNNAVQVLFPSLVATPDGVKLPYGALHVLVLIGFFSFLGSYLYLHFDLS